MTSQFTNPILPGFYPDPSCIRVGDTFYMANSSFQFFPAIPIHKSKDLINWEHIGNALNRPDQLSLSDATTKVNNAAKNEIFTGGIYAPTLRHHNGMFYIVCTFLRGTTSMPSDADFQPENFLITATDLSNPSSYSNPIPFDFYGIDPSLFFDDETGKVYMQGSFIHGYRKFPATVIRQAEINVKTGALLSPAKDIWGGVTGKCPEGPHIYKKDGFYYLLIAEGGTHRGHKVAMARSQDIWGPYESCPANPVLTTAGPDAVVQCVGHAELFQDGEGEWWAVLLARREYGASFPLGRETYLTPVRWEQGEWPVFAPVEIEQRCDRVVGEKVKEGVKVVSLDDLGTVFLRSPDMGNYVQEQDGGITLIPGEEGLGVLEGTMTFVGRRQVALDSTVRVKVPLQGLKGNATVGFTVYKDPFRYVAGEYHVGTQCLSFREQKAGKEVSVRSTEPIEGGIELEIRIKSSVEEYALEAVITFEGGSYQTVSWGEVPAASLSGDDFTGTIFAIYASGDKQPVKFTQFEVESL